jgi:hypothetical protein
LTLSDPRNARHEPVEYLATVSPAGTTIAKDPIPAAVDARVSATTLAWKALVIGGARIEDAHAVAVTGDTEAVRALVDATRLETPEGAVTSTIA